MLMSLNFETQWPRVYGNQAPAPYFKFNEAVSFLVVCEDQKEIDYYWEKLSAVPESEQCGWCKDKFGYPGRSPLLSWQK